MYDEAHEIVTTNRDKLETIAESLLERETLEASDLALLISGQPLPEMTAPSAGGSGDPEDSDGSNSSEGVEEDDLPDPEPFPS
jgi:hypothetical protein